MRSSSLVFLMAPYCGSVTVASFVIPTPKAKVTAANSSRNLSRDWNGSWGIQGPPPYQNHMIDQRYDNQPDLSELDYRDNGYNTQDLENNLGQEDDYYDYPRPPYDRREFQQQYADFDRGSPIGEFEDRQSWEQHRYGDNFGRRQEQYIEETDDSFDDPQKRFGRQDDFSDEEYREGDYYNNLPRPPPPPPQQYQDSDYFDQGQSQDYGSDRYDTFEGRQQQLFNPRSASNRAMVRQNRSNRRQQLQQYGPLQKQRPMYEPFDPGLGAPRGFGGGMISPFVGFGMMDRMMGEMANSFGMMDRMMYEMTNSFGMMDQMMGRMSSEMEAGVMNQELVEDARAYIQSDPAVTDTLGDNIQFGPPFAQSSSSAFVNGVNRSHFKLGMPIRGNRGQGRVMISADEEGINQIGVDVGEDRIIEVLTNEKRGYNSRKSGSSDIIDVNAEVEEED